MRLFSRSDQRMHLCSLDGHALPEAHKRSGPCGSAGRCSTGLTFTSKCRACRSRNSQVSDWASHRLWLRRGLRLHESDNANASRRTICATCATPTREAACRCARARSVQARRDRPIAHALGDAAVTTVRACVPLRAQNRANDCAPSAWRGVMTSPRRIWPRRFNLVGSDSSRLAAHPSL